MTTGLASAPATRTSIGTRVFTLVLVVALVGAVWWAFDFRAMALASVSDPDCPTTGCYAPFGPIVSPVVSIVVLAAGLALAFLSVRSRRSRYLASLVWVAIVGWIAVVVTAFASLVD